MPLPHIFPPCLVLRFGKEIVLAQLMDIDAYRNAARWAMGGTAVNGLHLKAIELSLVEARFIEGMSVKFYVAKEIDHPFNRDFGYERMLR